MEIDCQYKLFPFHPGLQNFFSCGGDLSDIGDDLPDVLGGITASMRACQHLPDPGDGEQDKALCAGAVIATVTYVAAAALQFDFLPNDCVGMSNDDDGYYDNSLSCSMTIGSALSILATATAMAESTATSCSGINTDCAQDTTNLAAEVFDVQTAISNVANFCHDLLYIAPAGVQDTGELSAKYAGLLSP